MAARPAESAKVFLRRHTKSLVGRVSLPGGRLGIDAAAALVQEIARVEDGGAIVLLLDHAGRDFCLGFEGDIADWPHGADVVAALAAVRLPVVAAVRGRAEAEGLELVLAADLRVVAASTRFRASQIAEGRMPRFGATQRLPRLVGAERAMRMILLGESVGGREAVRIGLATRLAVDPANAAAVLAEEISTRAPIALRFVKEAVRRAPDLRLDDGARFEHDLYALLHATEDRVLGVRAFLTKRTPRFRGK